MGFGLLWTPLVRRLSAIALFVIFNAAVYPFGRTDLASLVDPYLVELDHDFDCLHFSNPLCSYVSLPSSCLPQAAKLGTALYLEGYGDFGAAWAPAGCP